MKFLACLLIAFSSLMGSAQAAPAKLEPVEHTFVIHNFHTESGIVLPEAKIVYGTYGHLNAAGDNAILLPSHYMADMHGYGWLIGPGKALDPARHFLITTELFGNGRSSSPSNTPEPFHGPRFPVMTIRDNVEAVHQLLTQDLGCAICARSLASPWARSRHFNGRSPIPPSWIASLPLRARQRPTVTASCAWRARSPPSPPMKPSRAAITRRSR